MRRTGDAGDTGDTGDTGDVGDAGAPLRGDGEDIVQGTPLERLSGNLRVPLWSFVSFVIPRNTSPLSNTLFVARLPRPCRSNQASKFPSFPRRKRPYLII